MIQTRPTRRGLLQAGIAGAAAWAASPSHGRAAQDVSIGAIFPLTGNSAQVGIDARAALEVAARIVNAQHPAIPIAMGEGGGLPRLGGAQLRLVFADHQADPQKARAEAERLLTQENVAALIGSYQSAASATIGQVAERYQRPMLCSDSSSPSLTKRGLKWFFRTSPHDEMFTAGMFSFFKDIGAKTGRPVHSVALIYEDSIFGSDSSNVQRRLAQQNGITVAADIRYRANSPSMTAEAERLKAANADVVMPSSYTNDAILLMRAMHDVGYAPKAVMAQAAGFAEQDFLHGAGPLAEGVMSRSSFALDAAKARPAIATVNDLYRAQQSKDLNDNSSRELTGLLVLADAINRAGSTSPEAIRAALAATDIPGTATIMPWRGVKFDASGQNALATPVIQQVRDGSYHTVWPFDLATTEPVWNVGR